MLKLKRCFSVLVGVVVLVFSCVMSVLAESESYEYELDLTCSANKYFDDEEDTTTYFYVETDYEGEYITLVNAEDLTEYKMLDDGKFSISGDDMPYDAVYSAKIELDTSGATYENPKVLSFYAITEDGVKSKTITIKIVKRITALQISEMAAVNEMINALKASESYTAASFEEKTSMVHELLVSLAENGTEEYPYSLIFPDSINFTGKMYAFKYSCGALGGVSIDDPFQTETTTTTAVTTEKTETTATYVTQPETTVSTELTSEETSTTKTVTTASSTQQQEITTKTETTESTGVTTIMTETTSTTSSTDNILRGDCNDDGIFNISDVVLLKKWLVAIPDTKLPNWKAGDLYEDDKLNVFDFCMMRKLLLYGATD